METYEKKIVQLRTGEIHSLTINKDEFLSFREILIKQHDFKHFRGVAKQGGAIIYSFLQQARS